MSESQNFIVSFPQEYHYKSNTNQWCINIQVIPKDVLNKSGLMRLQWKIGEFKAKIANHSTAMAKIFNAEIVHFICSIANHGLFSISPGDFERN